MTKKEFKKFVKDHKKEIAIGVGTVILGSAVFIITKKKIEALHEINSLSIGNLTYDGKNVKLFVDMCETIDEVRDGSKMYVPALKDDLIKVFNNDRPIVVDPNGKLLEVTGGIFFGNEVEE